MEKYVLKQIEVQAVQWDGLNETYEKLMTTGMAGKILQFVQPTGILTVQDPKSSRGANVQNGMWIVVFDDGNYSLFDDANFRAKFELATTPVVPTNVIP